MNDAGPLRGIFDRVVAGEASSADLGPYADLDPALLGDALVAYADTAPVEVAEHLEPFVTAATAGEPVDPGTGLDLLAEAWTEAEAGPEAEPAVEPVIDPAADFDFGTGTTQLDLGDLADGLADHVTDDLTDGPTGHRAEDSPDGPGTEPTDRPETDPFDGWLTEAVPASGDDVDDPDAGDDLDFGG